VLEVSRTDVVVVDPTPDLLYTKGKSESSSNTWLIVNKARMVKLHMQKASINLRLDGRRLFHQEYPSMTFISMTMCSILENVHSRWILTNHGRRHVSGPRPKDTVFSLRSTSMIFGV
ncbi:hypothetical protein LSH36_164g03021, partial [Paralvinella palmiformis]